jgi:hypothetical protein
MDRQPNARLHIHIRCQEKALLAYSEQHLSLRTLLPWSLTSDEFSTNIFLQIKGFGALKRVQGKCA